MTVMSDYVSVNSSNFISVRTIFSNSCSS